MGHRESKYANESTSKEKLLKHEDRGRQHRGMLVLFSLALTMVVKTLTIPSLGNHYNQLVTAIPSITTTLTSFGHSLQTNNLEIDGDDRGLSDDTIALEHAHVSTSTLNRNQTEQHQFTQKPPLSVRTPQISGNKVFSHFYSHIPKTGGYYAAPSIMKVIRESPEFEALNRTQKFRVCNEGARPTHQFGKYRSDYRNEKCTMWMSEDKWTEQAQHTYTIFREPRAHIISQYFHCTESKDHAGRRHLMPDTLLEWLQAWVEFDKEAEKTGYNRTSYRSMPIFKKVHGFRCYDPLNMQSRYARFNPDEGDGRTSLESKFRVTGDLSKMDQTVCVIAIEYAGYVPPACDCTKEATEAIRSLSKNNGTSSMADLHRQTSHGVKHHGASHSTTSEEDRLIAQLVKKDQILFEHATSIFDEHVERLEHKYSVSICKKIHSKT